MMDFITMPLVTGVVIAGIYGLFELFVRRKERLAIIEKIGEKLEASSFDGKLNLPSYMPKITFSALKIGSLMAGIGLGLLVGFIINVSFSNAGMYSSEEWHHQNGFMEVAYGASVLLFGGIGLLIAFIIELNIAKKKNS
jgi:hypothetical protein